MKSSGPGWRMNLTEMGTAAAAVEVTSRREERRTAGRAPSWRGLDRKGRGGAAARAARGRRETLVPNETAVRSVGGALALLLVMRSLHHF
jgi:hypothetical protein